jgi:hypothetical protein
MSWAFDERRFDRLVEREARRIAAKGPAPKGRWSGLQAFFDKARADDEAFEQFEKELAAERGGFSQATLEATAWLRKFHPERLESWFANHSGLKEFIDKKKN